MSFEELPIEAMIDNIVLDRDESTGEYCIAAYAGGKLLKASPVAQETIDAIKESLDGQWAARAALPPPNVGRHVRDLLNAIAAICSNNTAVVDTIWMPGRGNTTVVEVIASVAIDLGATDEQVVAAMEGDVVPFPEPPATVTEQT